MTLIKTEGLILKSIPFKDTSNIVKLFTREQGKIAVIAKGARRMKSPFRGYLQPLNYVEIIYYYKSTRDIQTLSNVDLIQAFFSNSGNIDDPMRAIAVLELIDKVVLSHEHDADIFSLATDTLQEMDAQPTLSKPLFVRFLIQLIDTMGYRLNLSHCAQCKNPLVTAVFDSDLGHFHCEKCRNPTSTQYYIREDELRFIHHIQQHAKNRLSEKYIQPKYLNTVSFLLAYLAYHVDHPIRLNSLNILTDTGN